jgi:hypothetical protein
MEPENRQACHYCEELIPRRGPLRACEQIGYHSLGSSISEHNCGFCNAVAIQLRLSWPERQPTSQVQTFEEFIHSLWVCPSVTDVKTSLDGVVSWGTWGVKTLDPRGDTGLYIFHIQICEPTCKNWGGDTILTNRS